MTANKFEIDFRALGEKIAEALLGIYDEADFELDTVLITKDLHERCLHEAQGYFYDNPELINDDFLLELVTSTFNSFAERKPRFKKLRMKELVAFYIRVTVIDILQDNDIYCIN